MSTILFHMSSYQESWGSFRFNKRKYKVCVYLSFIMTAQRFSGSWFFALQDSAQRVAHHLWTRSFFSIKLDAELLCSIMVIFFILTDHYKCTSSASKSNSQTKGTFLKVLQESRQKSCDKNLKWINVLPLVRHIGFEPICTDFFLHWLPD